MIKKALCTLAIAAPLTLALALPAHAGSTYPPNVEALVLTRCALANFELEFIGLAPGTQVKVSVKFDNKATINTTATPSTQALDGTYQYTYSEPYPPNTNKVVWTAEWYAANGSPGGVKKTQADVSSDPDHPTTYYRRNCPDLPVTGGNAAPIGKIALGAVLAGGVLATVAIRRRPRKAQHTA